MENVQQSENNRIITIPNLLSLFRICLIPVFVWLYCAKKDYTGTVVVLLISGVTDFVDGLIARKFHMVSDLGKILDPIADKLTQATMLICLFTRFSAMLVPFLLMAAKELFMSITGILVIRKTKEVFSAGWHGKVATFLLDAMLILHVIWPDIPGAVSNVSVAVCTVMIAVSFLFYGSHNVKSLRS